MELGTCGHLTASLGKLEFNTGKEAPCKRTEKELPRKISSPSWDEFSICKKQVVVDINPLIPPSIQS